MKIRFFKNINQYQLGVSLVNWGLPIDNQWEIQIHFFMWNIGIDLFREQL